MPQLAGTQTHANLRAAFAEESQANRRYLHFAKQAEAEGHPEIAGLFRDTAESETGHAHGHLEFLQEAGDPATGLPIGTTELNLAAAIAQESQEQSEMYPRMAQTARDEGFDQIAMWFETLAHAEHTHTERFRQGLSMLR